MVIRHRVLEGVGAPPGFGGPLGSTGILFEVVGLGRYEAPLGNGADTAVGGALGYQKLLGTAVDNPARQQLIFELGGREGPVGSNGGAVALGRATSERSGSARFFASTASWPAARPISPTQGFASKWLVKF